LKIETLQYLSTNKFYSQLWFDLFSTLVKLYEKTINTECEKKTIIYNSQQVAIPILMRVLQELIDDSESKNKTNPNLGQHISQKDIQFLDDILKNRGGVCIFQSLLSSSSLDERKEERKVGDRKVGDRNYLLLTKMMNGGETKFVDNLSLSIFNLLQQQVNLSTITGKDWPIIISSAVDFVKTLTPPINASRQKIILNEVVPKVIEIILKADDNNTADNTKKISENLKPIIDNIYNCGFFDDSLGRCDDDAISQNSQSFQKKKSDGCCVLM
jgi:hypothetical protein